MKKALITGVTGQDGAYLAELLLDKGYEVHGLVRHASIAKTDRIDQFLDKLNLHHEKLTIHQGDMTDSSNLTRIIGEIRPHEIYNLAAQSHVAVSFEMPEYTADVNALGALRILEAIRANKLENETKYYQASTSELFGQVQETPQSELTSFYPRSPYGVAKLYAYWMTVNYRESYGLFACNGILFNHESPIRGENFVTRKITLALCNIKLGLQKYLYLGNLDSKRDWGHARDFVKMQWLMLQQDQPNDFVIATGVQHSVRNFIEVAASKLGMSLEWKGAGLDEVGLLDGEVGIKIDAKYFRPAEVETLIGDTAKARKLLGWSPKTSFDELVSEMISKDLNAANRVRQQIMLEQNDPGSIR